MSRASNKSEPLPVSGDRMLRAAEAGLDQVDRAVAMHAEVADELTNRLRRAAMRVMQLVSRNRLAEAALAAGQVSMLSRQIEIRLLSAVERAAGASDVAQAVVAASPAARSPAYQVRARKRRARPA